MTKKDNMSNQRQRAKLLEENIKLKKEKEEMNNKMDELLSLIDDKMSKMLDALNDIKNKEAVIVQSSGSEIQEKDGSVKKATNVKPFIPSSDAKSMKMNVSTIDKKQRQTDISDAASKLSKLQDNQ